MRTYTVIVCPKCRRAAEDVELRCVCPELFPGLEPVEIKAVAVDDPRIIVPPDPVGTPVRA